MPRAIPLGWLLAVAVLSGPAVAHSAADRGPRTWFVDADAKRGGTGDRGAPFARLRHAERASAPGDRIVVLRSRRALDGGIALKPRQRLIGAGPALRKVIRRSAPRITNTRDGRNSGDAVTLADRVRVRNLVIAGSHRGAIYGRNVSGVRVRGNDVSAHNASCTEGFHIPSFEVPTTAPGLGIPIADGLKNGWAGIMVDADRGRGRIRIARNRVHDAECGDGIDVRLSGTARYRATVRANTVADLRQGESLESVLAIGLQTLDQSRLVARLARNSQANLGNEEDVGAGPAGADTEGVFVNPAEGSRMKVTVTRNTYTNPDGLGGFSGNGLEYVTMGDGSRSRVVVRKSNFSRAPGDVLEQLGLGTNAVMELKLVEVTATRSLGFSGSGFGNTVLIPGNNADCLLAASGGAGNSIETTVRGGEFSGCANNGITFGSAVANGEGPTTKLHLDIRGARITANRGANLRVGNETALDELSVRVEDANLSDSRGTGSGAANVSFEDLGTTGRTAIDLGGGALGSAGGNCIAGGSLAAVTVGYAVSAKHNWWGAPAGPAPGSTVSVAGALDSGSPLAAPPPSC